MDRVNQAQVYFNGRLCGRLARSASGYMFQYAAEYLKSADAVPLSGSLPLRRTRFESAVFLGFFSGLVAEGWLLRQQSRHEKIDERDLLTLLARNGEDLAGAVTLRLADAQEAI